MGSGARVALREVPAVRTRGRDRPRSHRRDRRRTRLGLEGPALSPGAARWFASLAAVMLSATACTRGGVPTPSTSMSVVASPPSRTPTASPTVVVPTGVRCTITGTLGPDVLRGTLGDDVICGLG